jgi:hypothetical protein
MVGRSDKGGGKSDSSGADDEDDATDPGAAAVAEQSESPVGERGRRYKRGVRI